jgi:hypothetical protein
MTADRISRDLAVEVQESGPGADLARRRSTGLFFEALELLERLAAFEPRALAAGHNPGPRVVVIEDVRWPAWSAARRRHP